MLSALYPSKLATMQAADYYSIERPHENTSLVARFRKDVPRSVVTDATPAALAAFQARLSAACTRTCMPVQLLLPFNSPRMGLL